MNNSQCSSMKQPTNKDSSTNNAHFHNRISHLDFTSKQQAFFLAAYLLVQSSFPLNFQSGCWKAAFRFSDLVPSICIILMSPQVAKIKILSLCIFICSPPPPPPPQLQEQSWAVYKNILKSHWPFVTATFCTGEKNSKSAQWHFLNPRTCLIHCKLLF